MFYIMIHGYVSNNVHWSLYRIAFYRNFISNFISQLYLLIKAKYALHLKDRFTIWKVHIYYASHKETQLTELNIHFLECPKVGRTATAQTI